MTTSETTAPPQAPPPRSRLPEIPGPLETFGMLWRRLRRMSTALLLLFTLAAAAVVATVIPQEPVTTAAVADWRAGAAGPGETVADVLDALGLFDVFGSWWFAVLTVLLFTSLTGCLVPRWRAFARTVRRPPPAGRNLGRLRASRVWVTDLEADAVLAAADAVLRRKRFRRRRLDGQLAAERGSWREGGSLLFHTSFYVVLAGAVIGQLWGFKGNITLAEGASFAETRIAYDLAEPGRYWGLDDHRGFVATLEDFEVTYHDNFTPRDFVSTVTVAENGEPVRTAPVRVNHPLRHDGITLYQNSFGFAPRIVVRVGDTVLRDERVLLGPAGGNVWSGAMKVRFDDPDSQIALDLALAPDARLDDDGNPVIGPDPRPANPVLIGNLYFGELGLEQSRPVSQFDRGSGAVDTAMLRPGSEANLVRGNLTVEFVDLGYWSGFQVAHAPGRWLLLLGAVLLLAGLIPSLYSYRRRIWVEVRPAGTGSSVTLAGVALHRKATFDDEFDAVATELRRSVPPRQEHDT